MTKDKKTDKDAVRLAVSTRMSDALEEAKKQTGLNQTAIAAQLGIHQGNLSKFLSGQTNISFEQVFRFCDGIGLSPLEIAPEMFALYAEATGMLIDSIATDKDSVIADLEQRLNDAGVDYNTPRPDDDELQIIALLQRLPALETDLLLLQLQARADATEAGGAMQAVGRAAKKHSPLTKQTDPAKPPS